MSTIDLSRLAFDPRKHYAGVRLQQGRVLTDDDFNDAAAIDAEENRRTRLHTIGAYGSPDSGFLPTGFTLSNGRCDFTLSNGQLYLGGLRLEMGSADRFSAQKDWLSFNAAVDAPLPPADGSTRKDLVWIEAWQQAVSAVEDSELFEPALGGPDTGTRWRTMRRVHVASGVAQDDCAAAWAALSASFSDGPLDSSFELVSTATLTVSFSLSGSTGDLCSPPQAGGYLGAENQAIRVQMVNATHYTWGFDNAAPLYRVQVSSQGGQLVKVKLLTQPKDSVHWPIAGQVVEILPWSAALSNGQRIAELSGHLCRVAVSWNPDDQTLVLDTPLPTGFGLNWQGRSDQADFFDPAHESPSFFLRVWNRGDDLSSPAAVPIGTPALGNTGLSVAFSGAPLRAADHWVIAARPATPDVLTPWVLKSGASSAGVRRWRAPLALVQWSTNAGVSAAKLLHDCRPGFLPLTRLKGCCSVTVGDGTASHGQYKSINAAIAALPPSGGTVCILPGRYEEAVVLKGLHNISLHGCGPRSRIVAPDTKGSNATAVLIDSCSDIALEHLALEGGGGPVIHLIASSAARITSNLVQFRDGIEPLQPWPAIFAEAQGLEIEGNVIEPLPRQLPQALERIFEHTAAAQRAEHADSARGGIQLAGGSMLVRIASNLIVGGAGNGITLGSILKFDSQSPNGGGLPDIEIDDPCAPCSPVDHGTPPTTNGGDVRYESAGDLYDILIKDNSILRHGANGIAVVRFFSLDPQAKTPRLELVGVHGLRIQGNAIRACLRRSLAQPSSATQLFLGYGGISLALVSELVVDGNTIENNGRDWLSPVCGIFALAVDGLRIEHNVIRANGVRSTEDLSSAQKGIRAGIHIWLALHLGSSAAGSIHGSSHGTGSTAAASLPASSPQAQIRVHANVVQQPLGRALFMLGAGPMLVSDNQLLSEGAGAPATDPFATTVLIANLGLSREWTIGLLMTLILKLYYGVAGKGSSTGSIEKLLCTYAIASAFTPVAWPKLPTGKLNFSSNQVSFLMKDAPSGIDAAGTLLLGLDDVAVTGNQFEHHTQARFVIADLLALAPTLRSSDNRFAETWARALASVASLALMNTAADNQSTHCLHALGLMRAVHHNLVLAEAFCPGVCGDSHGAFIKQLAKGAQMGMTQTAAGFGVGSKGG
ncbi:DUF6519 domain-containing protein [Paucibacter sp. APW11]|uniref:DUF6519 domain-containing protein n=1 Tax=Roseateles aquae TaxID=3077235 RepID=A0ABU3P9B1_9BURK|nr:DUF6519 domain-containing protein [Paucibacter sp. APW11]MDT8999152.1 DUF6519 domain-containing protein [Paucibacter sp. APW11]